MSIYQTIFSVGMDEEHVGPLLYQGSHVLPSRSDAHGGSVDLGAIPAFITRNGRDTGPENGYHPWLRISVDTVNGQGATVVLSKGQATALRNALSEWLRSTEPRP